MLIGIYHILHAFVFGRGIHCVSLILVPDKSHLAVWDRSSSGDCFRSSLRPLILPYLDHSQNLRSFNQTLHMNQDPNSRSQ